MTLIQLYDINKNHFSEILAREKNGVGSIFGKFKICECVAKLVQIYLKP